MDLHHHWSVQQFSVHGPIKLLIFTVVLMTSTIGFCSSIHTAAISAISKDLGCSTTVATLGVTTFLIGFGTGPLIFAPLSEIYGRNPVYRCVLCLFVLFNVGCALSPNIAALLVFRFFSGFFGSPTVTNSGGSLTDLWPSSHRSVPLALFTAAMFLGPVIAPIIAGFLTKVSVRNSKYNDLSWLNLTDTTLTSGDGTTGW
jgi:multidrug resistance protein